MEHGGELSMAAADVVKKANEGLAVEEWVQHTTHTGFQPLTGITAEKHDSFITASLTVKAELLMESSHGKD